MMRLTYGPRERRRDREDCVMLRLGFSIDQGTMSRADEFFAAKVIDGFVALSGLGGGHA